MATGLLALLDDIAGIAKVAAATIDDTIGQAARAGVKATGVVIDDAAVTPSYVVGFTSDRELPIIWKIALGSLKNKLLYILPATLLLSALAPWLIMPLLMFGGLFLCYEGTEKVFEALWPHQAHEHEDAVHHAVDARSLEDQKVRGAIKTDFILSAEIMTITLAALETPSLVTRAVILAIVGVGITALVYGGVALIVKADDAGVALANGRSGLRALGRAIVVGMPLFLRILGAVGTAAMIWVGGGLIVHGLEEYGLDWLAHAIHDVSVAVGHSLGALAGFVEWLVSAVLSGILGLLIGAITIPVVQYVVAPATGAARAMLRPQASR
jgi:predicted DNA repair protein MutK